MYLSMLSPRRGRRGGGGGAVLGRANRGNLIMRSVPRVGILIVRRTFDNLNLPPGGDFDQ